MGEVNSFTSRQEASEAAGRELSATMSRTDTRLSGECSALRSKLDEECARLELATKTEAASVLNVLRSDEGVRLARLEGMFNESDSEKTLSAQRFSQELQGVRAEVAAKLEALGKSADAAENKTKQHLERVQEAMDCLNRELKDFVQVQEERDKDTDRLEQLVYALESRVYPWRSREQRGQSPG